MAFDQGVLASTREQVFELAVPDFKQAVFILVAAIRQVELDLVQELVPEESVAQVRWATPDMVN